MDKPNFNDVAQFAIAGIMVIGFISLTYMLVNTPTPNTDLIELLAAVFGGWIGAIIGFYFGQRPVKMLTEDITARQQSINDLYTQVAELMQELEEETE